MFGFRIPLAGFRIPNPWIPDSTDQNYLDSGFRITLHGATEPNANRSCRRFHIDLKVCWTPSFESLASFKNCSISSFVLLVLRALRVFTVPPLMISLSSVFICVALDISVLLTFAQALTPTFPTVVGPANETQLFT